jgi:hypothetical protein
MKRCLQCNRVESDEALSFCRVDGASLIPDAFGTAYLAMVLGRAGHVDEARKLLQEPKNASSRRDVPSIAFAFAYMGVNQKEEAMAMLEKEVEERGYWAVSFAVEPALDEFRSEPRFKAMLKRMNLPE